jgi:hypothetical protein
MSPLNQPREELEGPPLEEPPLEEPPLEEPPLEEPPLEEPPLEEPPLEEPPHTPKRRSAATDSIWGMHADEWLRQNCAAYAQLRRELRRGAIHP